MRREEDTTSLSATAKVLMSWAKHCCLLKIEGSYQLVAEDTPLCAPWSDNSPLCSAIGFPHLPDLSAPTRTVLHSLAWHRTAVSLPKLSLWHKRGASDAHLDKTARYPDMKSSVEKHFIDPIFETSLEHEVGLSRQFFIFISFQLFSIDKKKKNARMFLQTWQPCGGSPFATQMKL